MSYTPKKCSFCGRSIALGNGIMFIRNDGATFWYCSSKCKKNALELKRDPRKLKWARSQPRLASKAIASARVTKVGPVTPAQKTTAGKKAA